METSAGSLEARIAQAVAVVDGVRREGSVVDRDVLSTRLNALDGYLADLRPFAKRAN